MLAVLSERLKAIFDERVTHRGNYKTLSEEEADKTHRQNQRSLDKKQVSLVRTDILRPSLKPIQIPWKFNINLLFRTRLTSRSK